MNFWKFIKIHIIFIFICHSELVYCQDRVGTGSATQLLIPIGARDLALGSATAAQTTGVEAIGWNPAGLSIMNKRSEAIFSSMNFIAGINVSFIGAAVRLNQFGNLGISLKSLHIGEIEKTTVDFPDGTGETFNPTFFTVALSYGRLMTDRVSLGFNVKVISEQFPRVSATGFAVDLGVQYRSLFGLDPLSVGLVIKHWGPVMKYDGSALYRSVNDPNSQKTVSHYKISTAEFELPSSIEIGLGYHRTFSPNIKMRTLLSFRNNHFSADEYGTGVEVSFKERGFLRFGVVTTLGSSNEQESLFGPVFGMGLYLINQEVDCSIDYCYRSTKFFSANHVFSIKFGF